MIRATTIFNRAGTFHLWDQFYGMNGPAKENVRSLCGLVDKKKHLDELGGVKGCKRCEAAKLALECRGIEDSECTK